MSRRKISTIWVYAGRQHAIGDARLSLEREAPQAFDVLAVDAFTSDAIPVHLLTKEAVRAVLASPEARRRFGGACHQRYIDLEPDRCIGGRGSGEDRANGVSSDDEANAVNNSFWILITGNPSFFTPPIRNVSTPAMTRPGVRAWTDDYSNLWQLLR
jgi:hypothetical protein